MVVFTCFMKCENSTSLFEKKGENQSKRSTQRKEMMRTARMKAKKKESL